MKSLKIPNTGNTYCHSTIETADRSEEVKNCYPMKKILPYIVLHSIILLSTLGGICSKTAARKEFMSFEWMFFYGLVLLILAVYALLWQQIIRKLPLNLAYANKSVSLIWSMIWGVTVFGETISIGNIIGAVMVLTGIILMVTGEEKKHDE